MAQRPPIYAYLLCEAQHNEWNGDLHNTFIYITKIYILVLMTGYIFLQLYI